MAERVEMVGYTKTEAFFRVPYKEAHRIVMLPRRVLKRSWSKARYFLADINPLSWKRYDYGYYVDLELLSVINERSVDSPEGAEST